MSGHGHNWHEHGLDSSTQFVLGLWIAIAIYGLLVLCFGEPSA